MRTLTLSAHNCQQLAGDEVVACISWLQSYQRLPDEATSALASICLQGHTPKGQSLQPIGHTCRTVYVLMQGFMRIHYTKDGLDITESFEAAPAVVARVESLFSGRPSRKGIQALEPCHWIAISAQPLFALYDHHPAVERLFRKVFEEGYVETVNRLESLQFHTAEERYRQLLEEHPEVVQRAPLKYIASYLGITQVSLSRIRARR
jgi:CRP-like cAMP-binding protein